jgi:hypothetical protein
MSYLTSYATRNPPAQGRDLDERLTLNLPGFHAGAYIRVFVQDTMFLKCQGHPIEPRIRFRIADCSNEVSLWFELDSPGARKNSMHKIETLLGAVQRFRDALELEAQLYADREQSLPRRTRRC